MRRTVDSPWYNPRHDDEPRRHIEHHPQLALLALARPARLTLHTLVLQGTPLPTRAQVRPHPVPDHPIVRCDQAP
jgi:hypothetical protein